MRTFQEVGLEVYIENVATEAFDRVVERQDVDALAVFDVQALVYVDEITQLDAQVVASNLVHLNLALLHIVRA